MKKTNVDLQLKSKTYLIKYAIGNFIKSYYRYHRCIGEFHITLIDRIKQKLSMITAMEEINNVICEVAKDAIVHCSTILANCIEPTALDEMQNELWNFLQVMMAKKEPLENFKCDQHLINSSMKISAKVVTNLVSVMVLLSLFYY